jgi:hypothetical protein
VHKSWDELVWVEWLAAMKFCLSTRIAKRQCIGASVDNPTLKPF